MISNPGDELKPKVHFSGIGGTGMVSVARLAVESGWDVRGSDNPLYPPTSDMVAALNVTVYEGYAPENLDWNPDVVVIGNALSRGNSEVEAILDRGFHYVSFPEFLKDTILRKRRPIAVCGTHGKTTTTAIAAHLLEQSGKSPGYLIGGQPLNFQNPAYAGMDDGPFVVEGDEYDTAFFDKRAKFFHYLPRIAVVTSLEFDHADIYDNVEDIEAAFRLMLRQIPRDGHLIVCADSPRALALREHAFCNVHTYGLDDSAEWQAVPGAVSDGCQEFTVRHEGTEINLFTSTMFGRYNINNTLAAMLVTHLHNVEMTDLRAPLAAFRGIKRRMEIFHQAQDIQFVDDFAHHPTAIHETILGARTRWPDKRITVLFEPRSNTTATNLFQQELGEALSQADNVIIGPIYRPEKYADAALLNREQLAQAIRDTNSEAAVTDSATEIVDHLRKVQDNLAVVLILSNGAFDGVYEAIRSAFPA